MASDIRYVQTIHIPVLNVHCSKHEKVSQVLIIIDRTYFSTTNKHILILLEDINGENNVSVSFNELTAEG